MTTFLGQPALVAEFFVPGQPQPQGNKTAITRGGRTVIVEGRTSKARKAFTEWRDAITRGADLWLVANGTVRYVGPVRVRLAFRLPRPATVTPRRRWWPAVPPDLDKLARAVLDGLKPIWVDDAQVCELIARKRYAAPNEPTGVAITIEPLRIPEELTL